MRPTLEAMDACCSAQKECPELEIAGFHIGLFMKYLGFGAPHNEEDAVHGIAYEWPMIWDIRT